MGVHEELAIAIARYERAEARLRRIADDSPVERPSPFAIRDKEEWQYQYGKWLMSKWAREYFEPISDESDNDEA